MPVTESVVWLVDAEAFAEGLLVLALLGGHRVVRYVRGVEHPPRIAHSMASSLDFTWISQNPAMSSLASANGPSITVALPPL
jgi:hypothetical protein